MQASAFQPAPRQGFVLSIALLLLALMLQWALRPIVGTRAPYLFFVPAVGIAAMWLGWKPALIVLLGGLISTMAWLQPLSGAEALADWTVIAGYLAAAGMLTAMGAKFRQLNARAVQAEMDLNTQVQDLQAVHELSSRVTTLPDLHSQLTAILRTLCEQQGARMGLVALKDARSDSLSAAALVGFSPDGERSRRLIPVAGSAEGLAFTARHAVIVRDSEDDPAFGPWRQTARRDGFRAMHSRPVCSLAGETFGVLVLYFDHPRQPSTRDRQVGELCTHMASALAEHETVQRDVVALSRQVQVALESSAVPFCLFRPILDAHGKLVDLRWDYANGAAAQAIGREAAQLVGRNVLQVLPHNWDEPGLLERYASALENNATVEFEAHSRRGRWYDVIISPCEGGLVVWFADITERKFQEQTLREADRRKDEFLAILAHELRNPLAPIRQATLIARSPAVKPERQRWSLEVIDRQVNNMARLLDDLLDMSRISRGKLELRQAVTNLRQVADSALETARPHIEARRQQLSVEWPQDALWAMVDPVRIAQVLANLLTNASRYTPLGGSIRLAARAEGKEGLIEVGDNGAGIAPEALDKIFEMFTQVGSPQAAPSTGLGIGLALSRGLAGMHGGELTARSEGLGLGSTFTLRLDLCNSPARPSPHEDAFPVRGHSRRVLVADDNRDAAESLAEVLRIEGHEVVLAFDGEAALQEFRRSAPEVALLDIGMPGMTGNEVASAIRSSPDGHRTLLVAITGWGQERDRAAARRAGFDFHFTKPVDPQAVLRLLQDPATVRVAQASNS